MNAHTCKISIHAALGLRWHLAAVVLVLTLLASGAGAESPRQTIAKAVIAEDAEEQARLVAALAGNSDATIRDLLTAWKEGAIYVYDAPAGLRGLEEGARIPIMLGSHKDAEGKQSAIRLDAGEPLVDTAGNPVHLLAGDLEAADTSSELRLAMKSVLDLFALAASDPATRLRVVEQIGLAQDAAQLTAIRLRQKSESDPRVRRALQEAAALIQLSSEVPEEQIAAAGELRALATMSSVDALKQLARETREAGRPAVAKAADEALVAIANHTRWVNLYGTLFRGLSLGSILLVVAIGLAITFGLMGVINMAHGELIVVGAYTTFIVQNIFGAGLALSPFGVSIWLPGLNTGGVWYDNYFLAALPLSFLVAAVVGIALERGIIRFLYRRPLESLLATWGVSLVLQQLFRLVFGANNVQVYSPTRCHEGSG